MAIIRCEFCGERILGEEQDIQCPDCMNIYHCKCVEERNIEFETIAGKKSKVKVNYYRCPNCSNVIQKSNIFG